MFYVYEWFVLSTGEIFYVGKGCRGRYKSKRNRNRLFNFYIDKFECGSRIIKRFESEAKNIGIKINWSLQMQFRQWWYRRGKLYLD